MSAVIGPAGHTRPTSRRARVSEPTRPTRLINPKLLANPSHRHKRLLIYRRCRYFLIFPLLTYCCPRYIFFAQDGRRKGSMLEVEVVQNRQFIPTNIIGVRFFNDSVVLHSAWSNGTSHVALSQHQVNMHLVNVAKVIP